MHKRLILLGLLAVALLAGFAAATATAEAQTPIQHSLYQQYIDPFAAAGWEPARTPMPTAPPAPTSATTRARRRTRAARWPAS